MNCMNNYKNPGQLKQGKAAWDEVWERKYGQIMQSLKEHNLEFVFYSEWGGNHEEGLEQTKETIWIIIYQDPLRRKSTVG